MGTWGTAISSNDTYADIYSQFIDLYNQGSAVDVITTQLIGENQETINLEEDATNFWFAIANAQWECKALSQAVLLKVENIISSGEDLKIWKELGASKNDLAKREEVLNKFISKIRVEKDKPRKRVKKKLYNSIFKRGDCLTYIMDNGNYGGAFVLTDEENTESGVNHIAITTIDKKDKPNLLDFISADIYVQNREIIKIEGGKLITYRDDEPVIARYLASIFKNHGVNIEIIGHLTINKKFKTDRVVVSGWNGLKSKIPFKEEYIKINGSATRSLRLVDLINPNGLLEKIKIFFGFK